MVIVGVALWADVSQAALISLHHTVSKDDRLPTNLEMVDSISSQVGDD